MGSFGITEYPNTFKRQESFPLDGSSVFASLEEANNYAKNSKIAYAGQVVSVLDENGIVRIYFLQASEFNGFDLKELTFNNYATDNVIGSWGAISTPDTNFVEIAVELYYPLEVNCYTIISDDTAINSTYDITSPAQIDISYLINNSLTFIFKYKDNNGKEIDILTTRCIYGRTSNSLYMSGTFVITTKNLNIDKSRLLGYWTATNDDMAEFSFNILYPFKVNSFKVVSDDDSLNNTYDCSEDIIINKSHLLNDSLLIDFNFISDNVTSTMFSVRTKFVQYTSSSQLMGYLYIV